VIADLKPYPEYKESGLPWLGSVPEHWGLVPNRGLVRRRKVLVGERHSDYTLLSLTKQGVIVRDISTGKGKFSADMGTSQQVRSGDLVFCFFDVPETPRTVGLSRDDGMITGAYTVFEFLGKGSREYFELFYRAMDDRKLLSPLYSGLRNTIPAERFRAAKTPQPPPGEQAAIVRFLGWANGRLERAIRAKRKVIALLNEQKQAIINNTVTCGLESSVPPKPSGIPWLGDIPQHWETPLFGRLLTGVEQGWSPVAAEGELALNQWAVLTLSSVRRGVFNPAAIKPVSLTADVPKEIEVCDGDVLLTRSNTRDRVGDVCIVRAPRPRTILCDLIYRLRLRVGAIGPEFLVYQLLSHVGRGQIERDARGSSGTMPKISQRHIKSWRILRPPAEEQQRIVKCIDAAIAPVITAISRLEREIELLREYRTRLVADVVTGKLDVREAAAQLPQEATPATELETDLITDPEVADEEAVV
jgi:type I restriction enzyme, S subunit